MTDSPLRDLHRVQPAAVRMRPTGACLADGEDGPLVVVEFTTDEGAWLVGMDREGAGRLMKGLERVLVKRGPCGIEHHAADCGCEGMGGER